MRRTIISAMSIAAVFAIAMSCNKIEENPTVTDGRKANTFTVSDESAGTDNGYVWPAVQANNQAAPMYAKQTISGTFDSSGSGEHDVLFTNATEPTPSPDFTVSGVTGEFRTLSGLE